MIPASRQFRLSRLLISIPLLFLLGSTHYRRKRTMLRQTLWDGRRFTLGGDPWVYALHHLWTAFLIPLTLGWAIPWRTARLHRMITNETEFDGRRFHYDGPPWPLYRSFAGVWLGAIVIYLVVVVALGLTIGHEILAASTAFSLRPLLDPRIAAIFLGLILAGIVTFMGLAASYRAKSLSHQVSHTRLDALRFKLALPAGRFAWITVSNLLLRLCTLGVLSPVADARMARFIVSYLAIERRPA